MRPTPNVLVMPGKEHETPGSQPGTLVSSRRRLAADECIVSPPAAGDAWEARIEAGAESARECAKPVESLPGAALASPAADRQRPPPVSSAASALAASGATERRRRLHPQRTARQRCRSSPHQSPPHRRALPARSPCPNGSTRPLSMASTVCTAPSRLSLGAYPRAYDALPYPRTSARCARDLEPLELTITSPTHTALVVVRRETSPLTAPHR